MLKDVQNSAGVALSADDGAIWKRGRHIDYIMNKMQQALNMVQEWALQWGFRIFKDKTKLMIFTKKCSVYS